MGIRGLTACWLGAAPGVVVALLALAVGVAPAAGQGLRALERGVVTYFIAPPPAETAATSDDELLAEWAFATWQTAVGGALDFKRVGQESEALVRLYWAGREGAQYGEMRPLEVGNRPGAAVFVRPDTDAFGTEIAALARADGLFRDTIVYLTCVHELGHALGLAHTAEFDDIMYAFGFGGDITEYFGRFRARLGTRPDIPATPLLSVGDRRQLQALYGSQEGSNQN